MKSHVLLKALKEGQPLKRSHYEYYAGGTKKDFLGNEILVYNPTGDYFERHGWGSATGTSEERILDIFSHPEQWKIANSRHDSIPITYINSVHVLLNVP